ncbi:DUF1127 domain-containing protein [Albidovulum sediminicola]|uniref:DUF1127 domain-containing protein n=1 Tax=Albidovulum sediminicola TaxID=2984331 RepID=A0ABT2Z5A9_9RHOB|nr:DUF1127 domain-containing protein [Defluviimonas sp. WL0075]MCV2866215.1 DUF1127 domain-containing protein [Defluviimonas sp. WL0075]
MASYTNTRTATGLHIGFFSSLVSIVAAWNDARVTRNALSRLTDRELEDIGLCRGDIEEISHR